MDQISGTKNVIHPKLYVQNLNFQATEMLLLPDSLYVLPYNFRAFHHYRDSSKPLKKHPELERLLREEYRTLDDFRSKEKVGKAGGKECISSTTSSSSNSSTEKERDHATACHS